jgi:hypothetical protein
MQEFFRELMEPSNIKEIQKSEEALQAGGKDLPPLGVVLFEGQIMSRRKVFDVLVERASMAEEERKRLEEERERRLRRAEYDAEDAINSLLQNPNIPEEIREKLSQ